jgi:hypothetical protein
MRRAKTVLRNAYLLAAAHYEKIKLGLDQSLPPSPSSPSEHFPRPDDLAQYWRPEAAVGLDRGTTPNQAMTEHLNLLAISSDPDSNKDNVNPFLCWAGALGIITGIVWRSA